MKLNQRNYSQKSNFVCGSNVLSSLPFYAQTVNLPGVNFSLPEVGGRSGTRINLNSDTITFSELSIDIIIDEDYTIYKDIMNLVFTKINPETGTYVDFSFDFWIELLDDMGNKVMKIEYYNCKIESVGEASLDSMDDSTENVFSLSLKFDYFKIINQNIPTLRV